jgi:alpha-L-glutamate ligase-like protein
VSWYAIWRRLKGEGILGMNRRNAACILDLNPRSAYPAVDSKSKTYALCAAIGVPYPYLYGQIAAHSAMWHLPRLLHGRDDFVVKPDRGAGGRGILVVSGRDGEAFVRHNGERLDLSDLRQHVSGVVSGLYSLGGNADVALLQQRVRLHPSMTTISYQGIGDVRVILYKRQPAMAMLRLPTKESGGRANLHQGGIGAGVDLITGLTCRAVCRNRVAYAHPDTGASLVGFQVPYWPDVLNMAVKVARAIDLGYLGVDIVIDRDRGPLLLEANARPGLAIQIANGRGLMPRLQEIEESLAEIARSQKLLDRD